MPANNYEQHQDHDSDPNMAPSIAEPYYDGLPPKPQWLQGKMTMIGLAISLLGMIGTHAGLHVPARESQDFLTWLAANWDVLSQGVGILIAAYGRVRMNWRHES